MQMFLTSIIIFVTLLVQNTRPCDEDYQILNHQNKYQLFSSTKHGTYMIQSLMSVSEGGPCDRISIGGLIRVLAVKFAIETRKVATNLSIGYRIDDTCLNLPVTMNRGIEIINSHEQTTCLATNQNTCPTNHNVRKSNIFLAVIGGYFSFTTIPLSSLLSAYSIPQLSFGASSPLLSKRSLYKTTFRSIPSDESAVQALIDVVGKFGWTYIYVIGSDDEYGKIGVHLLKKHAAENDVCITGEMYIPFESKDTQRIAKEIALDMQKQENATVVVMFNYALKMGEYILQEASHLNLSRLYLTGEAWNPEVLSSANIPVEQLESVVTVSLEYGQPSQKFLDYVNETINSCYDKDIWLKQYIFQQSGCLVTSNDDFGRLTGKDLNNKTCEIESNDILQRILNDNPSQINNLIDLVDSVSNALDGFTSKNCPLSSIDCGTSIKPSQVSEALKAVDFQTRRGDPFKYDPNGNPVYVSYSIEQIQFDAVSGQHKYEQLGRWESQREKRLDIDKAMIRIPSWSGNEMPTSSCSEKCVAGEKITAKQRCCWKCERCPKGSISTEPNSLQCSPCTKGYHTKDFINCELTPIKHITLEDTIGLTTTIISCIGIVLMFLCLYLLRYLKETAIVKSMDVRFVASSTLLVLTSFCYTFLHLILPTNNICRVRNIFFHALLTLFSMVLLLKNRSVSRFISKFVNNKQSSTFAGALISAFILVLETAFILVWQFMESFPVTKTQANYEYFEECKLEFSLYRMLAFVLPFIITVIASVQSLSESHAKVQFGEYKFLHYTCLAFCIINVAHIITLNLVNNRYQVLVLLITTMSYGMFTWAV
ncbi:metabotropic glutamate receptor 3-like [Clytia hemisphaerica]|uniref:G-protein coupled receptors family 3 profile domain-containing protein n=1 Tax=Clytia hemisphaerica TaxID=252671 RepID=A0A7M5UP71_9CNID